MLSTQLQAADEAKFIGHWVRPDGGYKLWVLAVNEDGTAKVEYYNPKPIRVAEAKLVEEAGQPTLNIKFAEGNYAGSTYALKLQDGKLAGIYFQAMMGQNFEVFFERDK